MIVLILFWTSILAIIHTYVLYPVLIGWLARSKSLNKVIYSSVDEIPGISVLMAVHNEQDVIYEKLKSITGNGLPFEKFEIIIGSDASSDKTNEILKNLAISNTCLRYVIFENRMGKSAIMNQLVRLAKNNLLIITDANVILQKGTIFHLVKHFRNNRIGLVDSNMKHKGLRNSGISIQENAYISREVRIKYHEGVLWGTMMGPFGGCYAIRKDLYCNVPPLFLVDDFYINMEVIISNHKAIIEPDALVYEDVSNILREEFRRKTRIAAGNFQNLSHFSRYLFSDIPGLTFSYFSHKVLRWMGPFLLTTIFLTSFLLRHENKYYLYLLIGQLLILTIPLIDFLLGKIKIHIIILRFITHFLSMNFALLVGFIKFLKGIKTNVWQPTRRNQ